MITAEETLSAAHLHRKRNKAASSSRRSSHFLKNIHRVPTTELNVTFSQQPEPVACEGLEQPGRGFWGKHSASTEPRSRLLLFVQLFLPFPSPHSPPQSLNISRPPPPPLRVFEIMKSTDEFQPHL